MRLLEGYRQAADELNRANRARVFDAQPELEARVAAICADVRERGDTALLEQARQFDAPNLQLGQLRVTPEEIEAAWLQMPLAAQEALEHAARRIRAFHEQQPQLSWEVQAPDGLVLGQRYTPVQRVALYAPNWRASYPSTVLMLALPAQVAGVPELVLATPADPDGRANPAILAAARLAGITEIYKIGGAAAAAALALGTATVPRVDKIVGPGSMYFTLAKKLLFGNVGIDGLYGPSEVVVVAEGGTALAPQIAADLVAQAEHGAEAFVAFITTSTELLQRVMEQIEAQVGASPRADIVRRALENAPSCRVVSMEEACRLANLAAAEHVEIWSPEARHWSRQISSAGAIFLNTPVPLGDYLAGPSHCLPTGTGARYASGVGVETFLKRTTMIEASPASLAPLAADLEIIALLEQLPGHAAAVRRAAGSSA